MIGACANNGYFIFLKSIPGVCFFRLRITALALLKERARGVRRGVLEGRPLVSLSCLKYQVLFVILFLSPSAFELHSLFSWFGD